MTTSICNESAATVSAHGRAVGFTELVRGQDQAFLELVGPLVARESVAVDFTPIERIDAAGIAALVTLYINACHAGHSFTVSNASPRVARILALVGLDSILLSQNAVQNSHPGIKLQRTAA
jgi:anti-anti-sigma factor